MSSQRFVILVDGRADTRRLLLDQAAERIAQAHRQGRRVEARTATSGRGWRMPSHLEVKALALATALRLSDRSGSAGQV